jgi:hypothetical protein
MLRMAARMAPRRLRRDEDESARAAAICVIRFHLVYLNLETFFEVLPCDGNRSF